MKRYVYAAGILIQVICTSLTFAQVSDFAYRIDQVEVHSKILNETHTLSVYLPPDYEESRESYPVFYVLESIYGFLNAVSAVHGDGKLSTIIPETIVVGLNTSDRWRDLSPSHIPDWHGYPIPQSGGGATYLSFLAEEVIPHIDSNYRTQPFRIIFGHSLGGLFTLYSLTERPNLFNGYIASSPNLEYDNRVVTRKAEALLNANLASPRFIFFNSDNDAENYTEEIGEFIDAIDERAHDIEYHYKDYTEHDHWNVPRYSLGDGLRYIYKDYSLPDSVISAGANAIEEFYTRLSSKYGYVVKPMGGYINFLASNLLRQERLEDAISMLNYNVRLFPDSPFVYESLGDALLRADLKKEALENFQRSLMISPDNDGLIEKINSLTGH